jgi:hypothetical protein
MRRGSRVRPGRSGHTQTDYAAALETRLLEDGLSAPRAAAEPGQVLLIACGALAREILAINAANGWQNAVLECLPAKLHNAPQHIAEAVRVKVRDAKARGFESIFVVYADCGTGGALDAVCAEEGVERIPGPHCYAFFDGVETFEARHEQALGTLYLTDFFAKQFDALIWRGFGLDQAPEMRDILFANYTRVVYLAQTEDPELDAKAQDAAKRLGLDYERRFTGYGDLGGVLAALAEVERRLGGFLFPHRSGP